MTFDLKEQISEAIRGGFAERFASQIIDNPEIFPELYALTYDTNPKIAWRAMWVCEKISYFCPEWFTDKRSELIRQTIQCVHEGVRRSLLNILLYLPDEETVSVELLNFCLEHMLSPQEPAAIQSLCIKLAYNLCQKEPELLPELKCILANAEPEYYSKAIQATIRNTLQKMGKGES